MTTPERRAQPNRRRTRRQQPREHIVVEWRRNRWGFPTRVRKGLLDISQDGIRIVTHAELTPGDEVELQITGALRRPIQRQARVVWCVPTERGFVCVGLRFARPIHAADVQAMVKLESLAVS